MGWSGDGMMFGNFRTPSKMCVFLLPCLQKMDHPHILSSLMNSRASMRSTLGAGSQSAMLRRSLYFLLTRAASIWKIELYGIHFSPISGMVSAYIHKQVRFSWELPMKVIFPASSNDFCFLAPFIQTSGHGLAGTNHSRAVSPHPKSKNDI